MAQARRNTIHRTVKAIKFMENNKYWTIADLSDHLGIHKKNGRMYLIEMSLYLPIVETKPVRYGMDGVGRIAAVYTLLEPVVHGHKYDPDRNLQRKRF